MPIKKDDIDHTVECSQFIIFNSVNANSVPKILARRVAVTFAFDHGVVKVALGLLWSLHVPDELYLTRYVCM